jgi:1-acyl-sn-glycerol-3-phosphate acyltransferase
VRFLARNLLRLGGWQIVGEIPASGRYVLIAAPHTSNWDFVWTMAAAIELRVKLNWFAKHSLFKPVIGPLFKRWGGIPIARHEAADRVSFMAQKLREAESMVLLVAAEGTRSLAPYWKSGFYHIARQADVPIVLGFLDYARKRVGFGPAVETSTDVRADMDQIRNFYRDIDGKYPAKAGPIRLRDEEPAGSSAVG